MILLYIYYFFVDKKNVLEICFGDIFVVLNENNKYTLCHTLVKNILYNRVRIYIFDTTDLYYM